MAVIKSTINSIVEEVARITGHKETINIIKHVFVTLHKKLNEPHLNPKIRIYHFGSFSINQRAVKPFLLKLIKSLRLRRNERKIQMLRHLWKIRHGFKLF